MYVKYYLFLASNNHYLHPPSLTNSSPNVVDPQPAGGGQGGGADDPGVQHWGLPTVHQLLDQSQGGDDSWW